MKAFKARAHGVLRVWAYGETTRSPFFHSLICLFVALTFSLPQLVPEDLKYIKNNQPNVLPSDFGISVKRKATSFLEGIGVVLIHLYISRQYALFSWDQHVREQNHSEIHHFFHSVILLLLLYQWKKRMTPQQNWYSSTEEPVVEMF